MIRQFKKEDLEDAADLYMKIFNLPPWNETWTLQKACSRIGAICSMKGFYGLVYDENGITAFILGHREHYSESAIFVIDEIGVSPNKRREGTASLLMDSLVEYLSGIDVTEVCLTTIRDESLMAFYGSNRFVIDQEFIVMRRELGTKKG